MKTYWKCLFLGHIFLGSFRETKSENGREVITTDLKAIDCCARCGLYKADLGYGRKAEMKPGALKAPKTMKETQDAAA